MFARLFRSERHGGGIPAALYGAIVARAREPALFRDLGVPDTVEGRFEMVLLHTTLALRRLRGLGEDGRALGQEVFNRFCLDMDRSLREMGIGDLAVPKRMRKIGEAFYGRAAAYDLALDAGNLSGLADAINRNVFDGEGGRVAILGLADYMSAAAAAEPEGSAAEMLSGAFSVPDPASFVRSESRP